MLFTEQMEGLQTQSKLTIKEDLLIICPNLKKGWTFTSILLIFARL